jgi:predicted phosphodiesterase
MKMVVIGDLHGLSIWKDILMQHQDCDKVVFIGDYFDSKRDFVSPEDQLINFDKVLKLKRLNPDKVILLIGNHDFQYFSFVKENYGGYQSLYNDQICAKMDRAYTRDWIQMCHIEGEFLFSHAGVTNQWCEKYKVDTQDLEEELNRVLEENPIAYYHSKELPKSPIWIRPDDLNNDLLPNYIQVVGHTQQISIKVSERLILIDALTSVNEYLVIENNRPIVSICYQSKSKDLRSQPQHGTLLGFESL